MQYAIYSVGALMALAAVTAGPWLSVRVWRDPAYAEMMTQAGRVLSFGCATSR